eukprot:2200542-Rhodomonas_salina.1
MAIVLRTRELRHQQTLRSCIPPQLCSNARGRKITAALTLLLDARDSLCTPPIHPWARSA